MDLSGIHGGLGLHERSETYSGEAVMSVGHIGPQAVCLRCDVEMRCYFRQARPDGAIIPAYILKAEMLCKLRDAAAIPSPAGWDVQV